MLAPATDLVQWTEKQVKYAVKNRPVWAPAYSVGVSLDDLSILNASFSSEVGGVLNFFAYFFVSRQKSKWGFRGKALVRYMKIFKTLKRILIKKK